MLPERLNWRFRLRFDCQKQRLELKPGYHRQKNKLMRRLKVVPKKVVEIYYA